MNFSFDIDKKEKVLKVTVSLIPRRQVKDPKKIVAFKTVMTIINENLDLPAGYTLGTCHNQGTHFNNYSGRECTATWVFDLLTPMKQQPTSKKVKKKEDV